MTDYSTPWRYRPQRQTPSNAWLARTSLQRRPCPLWPLLLILGVAVWWGWTRA
jgi:hypothetical protein